MNLSDAMQFLSRCESNDPEFGEAKRIVLKAATMARVLGTDPQPKRSHEHLIWRNPFGDIKKFPHPITPKQSGEKT